MASVRHYNGLGQRTYRFHTSAPDFVILSAYDEAGQPIGQYSVNMATGGVNGHEVVYLESIPVAIAAFDDPPGAGNTVGFGPFYLHPDHLDTPRLVTDVSNQVLWRWDLAEPFGNSPANENPSGLGTFGINYRFPGQYLDRASNTHYNYFRDYDPAIGRYVQSDPIGLLGGINTYAYVRGDPMRLVDENGLAATTFLNAIRQFSGSTTAQQLFVSAKITSSAAGVAATVSASGGTPTTAQSLIQAAGGASTISLAYSVSYSSLGALPSAVTVTSATPVGPVVGVLALTGLGAFQLGSAANTHLVINPMVVQFTGTTLGGLVYDCFNPPPFMTSFPIPQNRQ